MSELRPGNFKSWEQKSKQRNNQDKGLEAVKSSFLKILIRRLPSRARHFFSKCSSDFEV